MKVNSLFKVIVIVITLFLVSVSLYAVSIEVPHDVEVSVIGDEEQSNGIFYVKVPTCNEFADINKGDAAGDEQNTDENIANDGNLSDDNGDTDPDNNSDNASDNPAADDSLDLDGNPLPTWEPSGEYLADIDIMILVNKENPVDETFVPQDLVKLESVATNRSAEWQVMTREAADAFNKLAADAKALGYEILATTAYRSYNFQSYLYNSYVQRDGQAAADTYSARPGKSEHQTGLATDVTSPSVNYDLTSAFGETAEGIWLAENCYKYGFILRFPAGKEEITGYIYEPWHIRYVGQQEAKKIYASGLAFEEYLAR